MTTDEEATSPVVEAVRKKEEVDPEFDLIYVEFEDGKPYLAISREGSEYTIDEALNGNTYYHMSGHQGGFHPATHIPAMISDRRYWLSPDIRIEGLDEKYRIPWPLETPPSALFDEMLVGEVVDCDICGGYVSEEELCRHLFFSEDGVLMGCGSLDCSLNDHKPSFFALLDVAGFAGKLYTALQDNSFRLFRFDSCYYQAKDWHTEDEVIQIGQGWLETLDNEGTEQARTLTCEWITEYLALSEDARAYWWLMARDEWRVDDLSRHLKAHGPDHLLNLFDTAPIDAIWKELGKERFAAVLHYLQQQEASKVATPEEELCQRSPDV